MSLQGASIHIQGIVQGVGFRPFVYGLAKRLDLTGWVRNTSAGVELCVDGLDQALNEFVRCLEQELPPLARIDELAMERHSYNGFTSFEIIHSASIPSAFQPVSPDVSICADCLAELFDPSDQRYRYPFINCTNCGPRFTIIQDIPYDRPNTTMAGFGLCAECEVEYRDPRNRRFHAQPVACPACGPQLWLETPGDRAQHLTGDAALQAGREALLAGKILAIKGLGGFHLACDATNPEAVAELRQRKLRVGKPFALMFPDIESIHAHCHVSPEEASLLQSRQRPVVILHRRHASSIALQVTPQQDTIGAMLPYTPLHYLLLTHPHLPPLVMTSGNLSEEPICTTNAEARQRLDSLADAFLMHDREIHTRCDDSVTRVVSHATRFLRRARGYAPDPLRLPFVAPPLLATGAELKNTFCLTRQRYAFLSHHIGDLENYETLIAFEQGIHHYERLFRIQPQAIAYDLHPDYLATRYALERAEAELLPALGVQHHHAHIAACMAENGLDLEAQVIGVAWDGTGYGEDGAIWGSEFLISGYASFQRLAHLTYVPLPGGDQATRQPWRMALAWLQASGLPWDADLAPVCHAAAPTSPIDRLGALRHQLETGINCPPTSSMGRMFDAAAALLGIRQEVTYEAQAAIELEALATPAETGSYVLDIHSTGLIDPAPLWSSMLSEWRAGVPLPLISARFHNSLSYLVVRVCQCIRDKTDLQQVALSGGVWQNMVLLTKTVDQLEQAGFSVLQHRQVPTNDGGLALGQAAVAVARLAGYP